MEYNRKMKKSRLKNDGLKRAFEGLVLDRRD